ncbi:hypothetical protein SDC9_190154 [bioreactor metagenome]|uniref:Uncharacterized protein n=1 Tax=bioreactor metagenome TaxID=1076179 RepID=A0A645HUE7_9ZZZZ
MVGFDGLNKVVAAVGLDPYFHKRIAFAILSQDLGKPVDTKGFGGANR